MKFKRSERLVDMAALLISHPYQIFSLNYFTKKYKSAKSSTSEDISIIKETFRRQDIGIITTYVGASGGMQFAPYISPAKQARHADEIIQEIDDESRILPGGYLYISDLLGDPGFLKKLALIMASQHVDHEVDYILTVATKGITLAQALGHELNVPVVIARKDTKVTEGPTVSVKYISQSTPRLVQTMEIGRESLHTGSKVILVDDFLRGEGTMNGMNALVDIFDSTVVAKYVLCENIEGSKQHSKHVQSIVTVEGLSGEAGDFKIRRGSLFK